MLGIAKSLEIRIPSISSCMQGLKKKKKIALDRGYPT